MGNISYQTINYNYSQGWLDLLESYDIIIDGATTTYNITYDDLGNPISITNFKYNGAIYDRADLDWEGRQLKNINIVDNDLVIISIAYTYNDQGYRISKSISDYVYTEQEVDIYNSGSIAGTALVPNTQNLFDTYDEITVYISGCGWHTFTDYGDLYIDDYDILGDLYLEVYPCGIYIYAPYSVYKVTGSGTAASASTITTNYTLSNGLVIYETDGTYAIYYTYDYDGSLISFHYDNDIFDSTPGEEYFYIHNLQGDVIKIIDGLGQVVIEYHYDGYGNIINDLETNPFLLINPYTYRGYRYDSEIGYYYLNSRFYNPEISRFMNADGLLGSQGNHNLFTYCGNNPIAFVDSNGFEPQPQEYCADYVNSYESQCLVAIMKFEIQKLISELEMKHTADAWGLENGNLTRIDGLERGAFLYSDGYGNYHITTTMIGENRNIVGGFIMGYIVYGLTALISPFFTLKGFIHTHPDPHQFIDNSSTADDFIVRIPGISSGYIYDINGIGIYHDRNGCYDFSGTLYPNRGSNFFQALWLAVTDGHGY